MKSAFSDDEIISASASLRILGGKIESDNVFDLVENTRRRILIIKKDIANSVKISSRFGKNF